MGRRGAVTLDSLHSLPYNQSYRIDQHNADDGVAPFCPHFALTTTAADENSEDTVGINSVPTHPLLLTAHRERVFAVPPNLSRPRAQCGFSPQTGNPLLSLPPSVYSEPQLFFLSTHAALEKAAIRESQLARSPFPRNG